MSSGKDANARKQHLPPHSSGKGGNASSQRQPPDNTIVKSWAPRPGQRRDAAPAAASSSARDNRPSREVGPRAVPPASAGDSQDRGGRHEEAAREATDPPPQEEDELTQMRKLLVKKLKAEVGIDVPLKKIVPGKKVREVEQLDISAIPAAEIQPSSIWNGLTSFHSEAMWHPCDAQIRGMCPECSGGTGGERSFSLLMHSEPFNGATFKCFR